MYAIIQIGSRQYKVSEGDFIEADRQKETQKKSIKLDKVLLYANGSDIRIGQPFLKDVTVTAKAARDTLGDKTIAFKYRKRKGSCTKVGHRQKLTVLDITKIDAK